jgi:hypothetical protein
MSLIDMMQLVTAEEKAAEAARAEAEALLSQTDWMVLREMDGGTTMPDDIRAARKAARQILSR